MVVFAHHLYEYSKGLRKLVLHTMRAEEKETVVSRLEKRGISYIVEDVSPTKINIFFGASSCIDIIKSFPYSNLKSLSPAQDFILGMMLGYETEGCCQRYLQNISSEEESELRAV